MFRCLTALPRAKRQGKPDSLQSGHARLHERGEAATHCTPQCDAPWFNVAANVLQKEVVTVLTLENSLSTRSLQCVCVTLLLGFTGATKHISEDPKHFHCFQFHFLQIYSQM